MQIKEIAVPNLDGKGQGEQIQATLEYAIQLKKQIDYVLKNLGTDNMETSVAKVLQKAVSSGETSEVITDGQFKSYITRTAKLIQTKVGKGEIISAINQSAEEIQILARRIRLEGFVSINNTFSVDEEGFLNVIGGKIGGFDIGTNGQYLGINSKDVAPILYWGNADILKETEIIDSGPRKDWRFKVGPTCGITAAGAIYANEGHFRGIVDAGAVSYGLGNTLAGDAMTNYTINVNKISSHAIDSSAMETSYATMKANIATILSYFNGTISANSFYCGDLHASTFYLNGHRVVTNSLYIDGVWKNVLTWS